MQTGGYDVDGRAAKGVPGATGRGFAMRHRRIAMPLYSRPHVAPRSCVAPSMPATSARSTDATHDAESDSWPLRPSTQELLR